MSLNYKSLTEFYNSKQLIPIIGSELLKIKKGTRELTFDEFAIEYLTGMQCTDPQCPRSISDLMMKDPSINENRINAAYSSIRPEDFDTTSLQVFASLDKFGFFISTCYDRKLEELIDATGGQPAESVCWSHEKKDPLVLNLNRQTRKIIHLFGAVSNGLASEEMSLSDDDKIEALFMLSVANSRNPSTVKDNYALLEFLRGKVLLFIGNNFQDWFMRFMVRTISSLPYKNKKSTVYIINDAGVQLGYESYFFEKYGINIIHDSPIRDVVGDLDKAIKNEQEFQRRYEHSVFISYDRTDSACARSIYDGLRNKGIHCWMDTEKLGMEAHQPEIERQIALPETTIFIAILSKTLVDKTEAQSYTKSVEWEMALGKWKLVKSLRTPENQMKPFEIVPVAVDDFKQYTGSLPKFIGDINISRCDDANLLNALEQKLQTQ